MRRHSTHARDTAIAQLSRINRWLLAGSVLLTGVFAEIAANAFPGHTRRSASNHATGPSAHRQGTTTSTAPLKPPEQAPGAVTEGPSESPAGEGQSSPPTSESQAGSGEAGATPSAPESQPAPEAPAESAPSEPAPEASGPVVSGGS